MSCRVTLGLLNKILKFGKFFVPYFVVPTIQQLSTFCRHLAVTGVQCGSFFFRSRRGITVFSASLQSITYRFRPFGKLPYYIFIQSRNLPCAISSMVKSIPQVLNLFSQVLPVDQSEVLLVDENRLVFGRSPLTICPLSQIHDNSVSV